MLDVINRYAAFRYSEIRRNPRILSLITVIYDLVFSRVLLNHYRFQPVESKVGIKVREMAVSCFTQGILNQGHEGRISSQETVV